MIRDWLVVKCLIHYLRKANEKQELGLEIDKILDRMFGRKKSEKIQNEIIEIMEKIIAQLKQDRR